MAFKRSGVRLPLSPPKRKTVFSTVFLFDDIRQTRGPVQVASNQEKLRFLATNGSGGQLVAELARRGSDSPYPAAESNHDRSLSAVFVL